MRAIQNRIVGALILILLALAALPALAGEAGGQVNVNTATAAQLELLPRIGPSVAQRIIEHREKNGAFKTAEDLLLVRGVGEKMLEQLKPYITVSGPTSLTAKVASPRPAKAKA